MGFFKPADGADEADDAAEGEGGALDSEDPGAVGGSAAEEGDGGASDDEAGAGEAPDPGI